jgi:hypothetical protein
MQSSSVSIAKLFVDFAKLFVDFAKIFVRECLEGYPRKVFKELL